MTRSGVQSSPAAPSFTVRVQDFARCVWGRPPATGSRHRHGSGRAHAGRRMVPLGRIELPTRAPNEPGAASPRLQMPAAIMRFSPASRSHAASRARLGDLLGTPAGYGLEAPSRVGSCACRKENGAAGERSCGSRPRRAATRRPGRSVRRAARPAAACRTGSPARAASLRRRDRAGGAGARPQPRHRRGGRGRRDE
jgi:hypothetical protein